MARDPGLFVSPETLGPYDVIEIRCWGCNRTVRWTAKDVPKYLPRDMPFKKMEPRLRCVRCKSRAEARVTFWRPQR